MSRRKKTRGKRNPLSPRESGYGWTVSPGNTVQLPLVDCIALLGGCLIAPQLCRDGCPAAELINELCVHIATIGKTFRHVKPNLSEDCSRDFRKLFPHYDFMPSAVPKPEAIEAGRRLKATRLALGFLTVRRFAQIIDWDESKLTKYENGIVLVPVRLISKLRQRFGVDHNWIYDADMSRLPHDLVEKLIEERARERQEDTEAEPPPSPPKRPSPGRPRARR